MPNEWVVLIIPAIMIAFALSGVPVLIGNYRPRDGFHNRFSKIRVGLSFESAAPSAPTYAATLAVAPAMLGWPHLAGLFF